MLTISKTFYRHTYIPATSILSKTPDGKYAEDFYELFNWNEQTQHWPPVGHISKVPIEPNGKKFTIYNTIKNIDMRINGDPRARLTKSRPKWMQEEIINSMLKEGESLNKFITPRLNDINIEKEYVASFSKLSNMLNPTMAITDADDRVYCHLSRDEFKTLVEKLPYFIEEMKRYGDILKETDFYMEERKMYHIQHKMNNKYLFDTKKGRRMFRESVENSNDESMIKRGRGKPRIVI